MATLHLNASFQVLRVLNTNLKKKYRFVKIFMGESKSMGIDAKY